MNLRATRSSGRSTTLAGVRGDAEGTGGELGHWARERLSSPRDSDELTGEGLSRLNSLVNVSSCPPSASPLSDSGAARLRRPEDRKISLAHSPEGGVVFLHNADQT